MQFSPEQQAELWTRMLITNGIIPHHRSSVASQVLKNRGLFLNFPKERKEHNCTVSKERCLEGLPFYLEKE